MSDAMPPKEPIVNNPPPPPPYDSMPQPQPIDTMSPQPVTIIVPHLPPKQALHYEPYVEYCPHCQKNVVTSVTYEWGTCAWIYFILGLFVFFVLCFFLLLNESKDAVHSCPECRNILATKQRSLN